MADNVLDDFCSVDRVVDKPISVATDVIYVSTSTVTMTSRGVVSTEKDNFN
jgi:hypothetical protein